jgi:hypothetical protein
LQLPREAEEEELIGFPTPCSRKSLLQPEQRLVSLAFLRVLVAAEDLVQ